MSTQTKIQIPHICSPVDYDKYLDTIIVTMYKVGKTATSKELVTKEPSLKDNRCVGRAASFLSYLGLVEGKKSRFDLSQPGREIALALEEGKKEDALKLWQQTLKTHMLYSELQKYIEGQGGKRGSSIGFAEHLRKLASAKWGIRYQKEGGKRLCVLFDSKGLLTFNRDEDSIALSTVVAPSIPPAPPTPPSTTPAISPPSPALPPIPPSGVQGTLQYTINIAVEAKDADSIKQVIALIKELKGQKEES